MNRRIFAGISLLASALLLAFGIPALAANARTVELKRDATLSGTTLAAGHYVVRWLTHSPQATVEFAQGHKVVLSTEGRLEERGKKYDSDMVVYVAAADGSMTISEIRFAGSSKVLVFKPLPREEAN